MIVQSLDDTRKLVYVQDPDREYRRIGHEFGMCDKDGNAAGYANIAHRMFTMSTGSQVMSWEMTGKTVTLIIVPDRVHADKSNESVAAAMNSFNRPSYVFDRYVFTGKFVPGSTHVVYDHERRGIIVGNSSIKDIPGIYDIMVNVGANNGKMYEPLVARYVTAMRSVRHTEVKAIGYFDLGDYLRIMNDHRAYLFLQQPNISASKISVDMPDTGCTVRVSSIDPATGNAMLAFDGVTVYDTSKTKEFRPYVVVSTAPLNIRPDMPFKSTPVRYGKLTIFLTPMMSKPEAWATLVGGLDLLTPANY